MASREATACKDEVYAMLARPLIPRRKLFDNSTFFGAKLSPDGRLLSWLASVDGVLNIWVSPVDSVAAGQPVTRTKGRPINWHEWSPDAELSVASRFLFVRSNKVEDAAALVYGICADKGDFFLDGLLQAFHLEERDLAASRPWKVLDSCRSTGVNSSGGFLPAVAALRPRSRCVPASDATLGRPVSGRLHSSNHPETTNTIAA